jgi:hypothetical protein
MTLSAKVILGIVFWVAILATLGVLWMRERSEQRRLTERAARLIAANLHGGLTSSRGQFEISSVYDGRPLDLLLGGKFLVGSDTDPGPDFVPTLDIKMPCSTAAQLVLHSSAPGGTAYLRDSWARWNGSKVTTGAADFDAHFLVQGPDPSDASILDEGIREQILASRSSVRGHTLDGHSWAIRVGDGLVEEHEVFNEGNQAVTIVQLVSDSLARVALLSALAASAEKHKPGGATPAHRP